MERIGRYEIRRELGRGGFGRVWAAFDPTVCRLVAIKTLTAAADPTVLARFRNEASIAGQLRHQNIVTIYDFGEHEGTPFLVMELLDGESLQSVIANRPELTLYDRVRILWELADGLQHAHVNGIVHRDIKPANIMLTGGHVKITDFGIALVAQTSMLRLTPQGAVIGTCRYMAPEQFHGDPPDALADIFCYGVVGFELLTGTHPFQAPDIAGVMYNILNSDPLPVSVYRADCPDALDSVIGRALQKNREARYQTLEDVKFDLEPVLLALRKQRTAEVLAEAEARFAADDLAAAQSLVREALKLDPASPAAWTLRDRVHRSVHRRSEAARAGTPERAEKVTKADQEDSDATALIRDIPGLETSRRPLDTLEPATAKSSLRRGRRSRTPFAIAALATTATAMVPFACFRLPPLPRSLTAAHPPAAPAPLLHSRTAKRESELTSRATTGKHGVHPSLNALKDGRTAAAGSLSLDVPKEGYTGSALHRGYPAGAPQAKSDANREAGTMPVRSAAGPPVGSHAFPQPLPPPLQADRLQPIAVGGAVEEILQRHPEPGHAPIDRPNVAAALQSAPGNAPSAQTNSRENADGQQISRTIRLYERAFENRSIDQLEAIWPGMPRETRESLRRALKSRDVVYRVRLTPLRAPEIAGDSASVDCERVGKTIANGVATPETTTRVRVSLARARTGWIITAIRNVS